MLFTFSLCAFSHVMYDQELIPAGHWIYDALYTVYMDAGRVTLADRAPLTAGEIKLYVADIDPGILSASGKKALDAINNFFSKKTISLGNNVFDFAFNVEQTTAFFFKSGAALDWSFATDYTGKYISAGDGEKKDGQAYYDAANNFYGSTAEKPFLAAPLSLSFSNYFSIGTAPILAKSFLGMRREKNFINMPYTSDDMEFLQPRWAYGSAGMTFSKWGFNASVLRSGAQFGKTLTGSVIYSSGFETDAVINFSTYSKYFSYNLNVVQVSRNKLLYLHTIDFIPYFTWLRFSLIEGTLVSGPFELRFLNPLMFMHSFGAFYDESDKIKTAQYFGLSFDIVPYKGIRLYGLFAQNEITSPAEMKFTSSQEVPDSFAVQFGIDLTFVEKKNAGFFHLNMEAVYTTPFAYIKQEPCYSLYRVRDDMQDSGNIVSWIGSPFGPDAIAGKLRFSYERIRKWEAAFDALFVAHGQNSFGMFWKKSGDKADYYPSERKGLTHEQKKEIARNHWLTGTVQYTTQLQVSGKYSLNEHFEFTGSCIYTFIFNNKNISGNFAHGVELSTSITCRAL